MKKGFSALISAKRSGELEQVLAAMPAEEEAEDLDIAATSPTTSPKNRGPSQQSVDVSEIAEEGEQERAPEPCAPMRAV
jgi:hypothetical protein